MENASARMALERPVPQNIDAERSVLAAILVDNQCCDLVLEKLRSDDFFHLHHRRIFQCMAAMWDTQTGIDLVTLTDELRRREQLDAVGGAPYLASLADGMPRVTNVEHYVAIVREHAILRNLIHAANGIVQKALDREEEADRILDAAESAIFSVAEDRIRAGFVGFRELVRENFQHFEKIFTDGKHISGLSTGYSRVDALTSGLQPSELIILAARPSMGKTALALNIAENVAIRDRKPIGIFSLEMSKESVLQRMMASHAKIDSHHLRTGHLSRAEWSTMTEALAALADAPISIDDSGAPTLVELSAKARRLKREKGLSLLIVDYLQLVSTGARFSNRTEEVASISRALKSLAKELKVPVLVLSQLTRAPEREERRPQLSDLRESGAIEQDADVVMFIHRPNVMNAEASQEEKNETELILAKQRNGPTGMIDLVFLSASTRFEEAAPKSWLK